MSNAGIIEPFKAWVGMNTETLWKRNDVGVIAEYMRTEPEKATRQGIFAARGEFIQALELVRQEHPREKTELSEMKKTLEGSMSKPEWAVLEYLWKREGEAIPRADLDTLWQNQSGAKGEEFPVERFEQLITAIGFGVIFPLRESSGLLFLSSANTTVGVETLQEIQPDKQRRSYAPGMFGQLALARPFSVPYKTIADRFRPEAEDRFEGYDYNGQLITSQAGALNRIGAKSSEFVVQPERGVGYRILTTMELTREEIAVLQHLKLWAREADAVIHLLRHVGRPVTPQELEVTSVENNVKPNKAVMALASILRKKLSGIGLSLDSNIVHAGKMTWVEAYTLNVADAAKIPKPGTIAVKERARPTTRAGRGGGKRGSLTTGGSEEVVEELTGDQTSSETNEHDDVLVETDTTTELDIGDADDTQHDADQELEEKPDLAIQLFGERMETDDLDEDDFGEPRDAADQEKANPNLQKQKSVWGLGEYVNNFILRQSAGYEEHEPEFLLVAEEVARRAPLDINDAASALKMLAYSYGRASEHQATNILIGAIERSIASIPAAALMQLLASEPRFGAFLVYYRDRHADSPVTRLFASVMDLKGMSVSEEFDPDVMTGTEKNYARKLRPKSAKKVATEAETADRKPAVKMKNPPKPEEDDEDWE